MITVDLYSIEISCTIIVDNIQYEKEFIYTNANKASVEFEVYDFLSCKIKLTSSHSFINFDEDEDEDDSIISHEEYINNLVKSKEIVFYKDGKKQKMVDIKFKKMDPFIVYIDKDTKQIKRIKNVPKGYKCLIRYETEGVNNEV